MTNIIEKVPINPNIYLLNPTSTFNNKYLIQSNNKEVPNNYLLKIPLMKIPKSNGQIKEVVKERDIIEIYKNKLIEKEKQLKEQKNFMEMMISKTGEQINEKNKKIEYLEQKIAELLDQKENLIEKLRLKESELKRIINEYNYLCHKTTKMLNDKKTLMKDEDQKLKQIIKEFQVKENIFQSLLQSPSENKKNTLFFHEDEKLILIHILSDDRKVDFSFACKEGYLFVRVEEKLYQKYKRLIVFENTFWVNGVKINRFKSIKDNGISSNNCEIKIERSY